MWLTFYSFNLNTGPMEECKYYLYSNIYIYVMPMANILLFSDCSIVFTLRGQRIKVASHRPGFSDILFVLVCFCNNTCIFIGILWVWFL